MHGNGKNHLILKYFSKTLFRYNLGTFSNYQDVEPILEEPVSEPNILVLIRY